MHGYQSFVIDKNPNHHTLQHCTCIPGCKAFYNVLGNVCVKVQQRYVICFLTALGLTIAYMQRMCLSIMMTEMVSVKKERKTGDFCPSFEEKTNSTGKDGEKEVMDWNLSMQGNILAAFFYGYFVTHIPGGVISDMFGGKHIYGVTVLLSSVCSALTPAAARMSPYCLLGVRLFMGLIQGPLFPTITSLVAHWSPPEERGVMNTICNTGVPMGLVLGNLLSGALLQTMKHWQYPFYIYACIGLVWTVIWLLLAAPTPLSHPFISNKEAEYIIDSLGQDTKEAPGKLPLKAICVDKSVLTATLANLGHEAGLFFIATELPIYLGNVMNLPISMNGLASAIPWMSMWVGNIFFGELSHLLVMKNKISRIKARRIFGGLCNIVPALLWLLPIAVGCNWYAAIGGISAGNFFVGAVFCSVRSTFLDVGPNYAGFSISIAASVAGVAGFVVPIYVHAMIGQGTQVSDWSVSFISICVFVIISTIPYVFMVSADVQPWNDGKPQK